MLQKKSLITTAVVALFIVAATAATYDQEFSKVAVYYSKAAFCEGQDLEHWKCGNACSLTPGVTKVTRVSDSASGAFGIVAYNAQTNMIVVSFRGSANIANWIANIDFFQTPYKQVAGAQVHRGFYGAYQGMSSQVIGAVRTLLAEHPDAKQLFTGHSLGAALATFAAADVKEQLNPRGEALFYTFGSPRTGNVGFTDHVAAQYQNYFRVVHANDIVPHLPMTNVGFNHVGTEVWYNVGGYDLSYKICTNGGKGWENEGCADTSPQWSNSDHMVYVGLNLAGDWCGGSATAFLE